MLNITDPKVEEKKPPLWRLAFRPFFLFGSLFSVIILIIWGGFLTGVNINWQPYGGWFWWHGHEMLFGFICAIIVGFLLTAVQTWSNTLGLSGLPLAGLFSLWALARLLMLFPVISPTLIAVIDTLFLPLAALILLRPIIAAKIWRNAVFVPLLLLLAWTNGHGHFRFLNGDSIGLVDTQTTILLITLIMVILGGRVIPFFTANANRTPKPPPILFIEAVSIISVLVPMLYSLLTASLKPVTWLGFLFVVALIAHSIRLYRWQFKLTLDTPLLWSLHLAYMFITASFGLVACYHLGFGVPLTTALHGLMIGGAGLLILAMISRVSLGHTGRILTVNRWIITGFIALAIAAVSRIVAPFFTTQTINLYLLSIAAWVLGYLTFIINYWPVLTQPRSDSRPG